MRFLCLLFNIIWNRIMYPLCTDLNLYPSHDCFLKAKVQFLISPLSFPVMFHCPPVAFAPYLLADVWPFLLNYSLFNLKGLLGLEEAWLMIFVLPLRVLCVDQSLLFFFFLMILVVTVVWECFCENKIQRRAVEKIFIKVVTFEIWLMFLQLMRNLENMCKTK